jgi:hypothetical protein
VVLTVDGRLLVYDLLRKIEVMAFVARSGLLSRGLTTVIKKLSSYRTDLFSHGKRSHKHFQQIIPRDWFSPRTEKKKGFKYDHTC